MVRYVVLGVRQVCGGNRCRGRRYLVVSSCRVVNSWGSNGSVYDSLVGSLHASLCCGCGGCVCVGVVMKGGGKEEKVSE